MPLACFFKPHPLSSKGDVLVISFDGAMAPMREVAKIAWREAGVATVFIYGKGYEGPEKRDTRFFARMPDSGMKTLLEQITDQVGRAKSSREFRQFSVICDGKEAIWSAASKQGRAARRGLDLDFYHATENLMKAAVAIFGEESEAKRWHENLRKKLILEARAVETAIRTMRRCRHLTVQ